MGLFRKKQKATAEGGKEQLLAALERLRLSLAPLHTMLKGRAADGPEAAALYAAPRDAAEEGLAILGRAIREAELLLEPRDARRAERLYGDILAGLRRAEAAAAECGTVFSPLTEEVLPCLREVAPLIRELLSA